jgi:NhaP-type Na+/H+ or K+/H+ antiporter
MVARLLGIFLSLTLSVCLPQAAYAQAKGDGTSVNRPPSNGPRKQLATIVFAGIAGAILGLSTLSFYGRPQDKLSNIAVGFAVGVISGTVYTTYKAATTPRDFYRGATLWEEQDKDRELRLAQGNQQPMKLKWSFSF